MPLVAQNPTAMHLLFQSRFHFVFGRSARIREGLFAFLLQLNQGCFSQFHRGCRYSPQVRSGEFL
jgi:hypothetical protein